MPPHLPPPHHAHVNPQPAHLVLGHLVEAIGRAGPDRRGAHGRGVCHIPRGGRQGDVPEGAAAQPDAPVASPQASAQAQGLVCGRVGPLACLLTCLQDASSIAPCQPLESDLSIVLSLQLLVLHRPSAASAAPPPPAHLPILLGSAHLPILQLRCPIPHAHQPRPQDQRRAGAQ